jgi:PAS domain S-box-containing protein
MARALWLAIALVLAVLFVTDLRAPLGALGSIPYVLAVVLSLALPRGFEPVVVAASCTAITLMSVLLAPADAPYRGPSLLHTGLPIFVVWVTAWLAQRYRRAGQAAVAADERIQLAATAAGFGTFDYDPVTRINRWSPGARRIVGLESEAITFDRLAGVIHEEDRERVVAAIREAESPTGSGQLEDEHRIVRPDGTVRWLLVKSRTVFDGEGPQRHAVHASGVIVDVTERRLAQEALRQSEERLRLLTERFQTAFQASPIIAFNQDRDLRYTWVYNPALDREVHEIVGRRDADLFERASDAATLEALKREVLETGESRRAEVCIGHADTERFYDLIVQPLTDGAGRVDGVTCAAIDITDAKQAQEALRTRNERLRLLSTTASQLVLRSAALETGGSEDVLAGVFAGVARMLRAGMFAHYNVTASGELELVAGDDLPDHPIAPGAHRPDAPLSAMVAATRTRLVVEDLQASTLDAAQQLRAMGVQAYAGFPLLAGGRLLAIVGFASTERTQFQPDEIALMQTVCDLVSAAIGRDQLAQSLLDSEERLRMANEAAGIGTFDIDMIAGKTRYSPQLCAIGGLQPDAETSVDELLAFLHPDDREQALREFETASRPGSDGVFGSEMRVVTPHAGTRWVAWRGRVFFRDGASAHEPVRVIGAVLDITERKHADEALAVAAASLKEADRRKDEFLATLAHELRNPLSPMRIAVTLLARLQPPDAELARLRQVIERQVDHLTRLVDDLLDVSRITRDKLTLRRETVDLADIIDAALDAVRPDIDRHRHRLDVSLPHAPLRAQCDVVRMTQVFSNLLNNAAKYTPPGGAISVVAEAEGDTAVIRVRDTGVGIPPEKLPWLFEMFYQADPPHNSDGGLGIGLTLVRRLLEMHGGSVEASSGGSGRGSEFVVRLPLAAAPATPSTEPEPVTRAFAPVVPKRILVVDDNRDSAEMLRALLEITGNIVHTVYDGEEALLEAERFHPDALLLDIGLPRMNGYDVCRRVREQPWGRGMLIVAQTGWGQDQDLRRSTEAGFDAHFTKPIDDDALLALLAQWRPDGVRQAG